MKKTLKYFALLFMGLAVVSCSDDDLVKGGNHPTYHSGDEIVFGASASVPAGDENAKNSRTAYGNVSANGKSIAINWVANDQIDIACPEAAVAQLATYKIVDPTVTDASKATNLERVTAGAGLQWNGAGIHNFYGIYPSKAVFEDKTKYPETMQERPTFNIITAGNERKAIGYLPMNYTAVDRKPETMANGGTKYIVAPNMDYAFMVANKASSLTEVNDKGLSLRFEPLATCLEFDITASVIANEVTSTPLEEQVIQLDRVELVSTNHNISGDFEYTYPSGTEHIGVLKNTSKVARNNMNLHISYHGMKSPVILKNNDVCTVNFFLMPDKNLEPKDLKVNIWYTVKGKYQRVKTATLGKEIQFKHKYMFKNFRLPKVNVDVKGSTWFQAVEPDVYVNQLSFLCAGNAFSNIEGIAWHNRQQVLSYDQLWDQGVRGFEFVNQSTSSGNIGGQHFVCGEEVINNSPTFAEAFTNLVKYLVDAENYKEFNNETLILFARYHAVNDGYHPEIYIKNVLDYLESTINTGITYKVNGKSVTKKLTKDRFVQLTPTSTAQDLRGKIVIIFRVADDAYLVFNGNSAKTTKDLQLVSSSNAIWTNNVVMIDNWGHAVDRWDMRYEGVARNATWLRPDNVKYVENYLWAASRSNTEVLPLYDNLDEFNADGRNTKLLEYSGFQTMPDKWLTKLTDNASRFSHTTSVGTNAMIQEWARVVPEDLDSVPVCGDDADKKNYTYNYEYKGDILGTHNYGVRTKPAYPWYRWPSSIQEKKDAIKSLFTTVVTTKGGSATDLFINVISGYFADKNHMNSLEPFDEYLKKKNLNGAYEGVPDFRPGQQGNGGNFAALAATLNPYVFKLLTDKSINQGPWGLVMCDYLGATEEQFNLGANNDLHGANATAAKQASYNLMPLFIANNFSFPLTKAPKAKNEEHLSIDSTVDQVVTD